MRSAEQIGRTVEQWHDYQQAERRRTLRELLSGLRHARENRVEWYVWVVEGQPTLTAEQYAAIGAKRRARRKSE